MSPIHEEVRKIIEPLLASGNYELVDLTISSAKQPHICVYIYGENGITIDDCAKVSRSIDFELETAEIFDRSYRLEVSSPGLNRPLKNVKDFVRNIGKSSRVFYSGDDSQSLEKSGIIKRCTDSEIVIEVDNDEFVLPLDKIIQGKLLY
ncbi:MAG: ribosome maturation factor RimP [candidate division Zixibacteria bacterium]|nr:ribosome maturation factor RimP [candidate division Zixibacteria bacterium]